MAYCHPMAQKSDSRDLDKVIVRLPDGMRDRIKAAAEMNQRSMNAEIVAVLAEHFPTERTVDLIVDTINHYMKQMAAEPDPDRRERWAAQIGISVGELRKLAANGRLGDIDVYLQSPEANRKAVFGDDIDPPPPAPKLGKNEPPF